MATLSYTVNHYIAKARAWMAQHGVECVYMYRYGGGYDWTIIKKNAKWHDDNAFAVTKDKVGD